MESAHEETGHGNAHRRTTQPAIPVGEAQVRRPPVAARPDPAQPAVGALPPRSHFDSQQWLHSRQPSPRSKWLKRGGAAFVTGMFGVLGWIGYQQMPHAVAKTEESAAEEAFTLEGETAFASATKIAFPDAKSVKYEPGNDVEPSAFDRNATAFRRPNASVEKGGATEANPFAAFERPASPRTEESIEDPFAINPARRTVPKANAGIVSLASNETTRAAAEATSDPFAAAAPLATNVPAGQSEPTENVAVPSDSGSDPFAAFAAQPNAPVETSAGASSVPGSFGTPPRAEPLSVELDWSPSSARKEAVAPAQFNAEPSSLQKPAEFEFDAKPMTDFGQRQAEPPPALNRPSNQFDNTGFDQPAAIEPGAMPVRTPARRLQPQTTYSPAVERAQTTGFNVPQPVAPANDPRDETLHVVQQGETYWSIARQHYGAGRYFQALGEYNKPRISDQQSLKPGMKVLVPSANTLDARYGKLMQASGHAKAPAKPQSGLKFDPQGRPYYIVGEGDTLGEIATRHLGKTLRSDEIYRLNQEQLKTPNSLKTGMLLVMPNDASEVQSASSIPGRR